VTFNWTGFDADGDTIFYTLFYREVNTTEWIMIPNAENIFGTSFTWDINDLEDGNYEVKIVGREDYEDELFMEQVTNDFLVKRVVTLGDEEREVTINWGLLFGVGAGFVILALVIIYIMFMSVRRGSDDEDEEFDTEKGLGKEETTGVPEEDDLDGAPPPEPDDGAEPEE